MFLIFKEKKILYPLNNTSEISKLNHKKKKKKYTNEMPKETKNKKQRGTFYGCKETGRMELLDLLPWPKEKNDLRTLLLQPSMGLTSLSLTCLFCLKTS